MRVAFFLRGDHERYGGGDLVQLRGTAAALRRAGVEIELVGGADADLSGFDLVHLFNSPRFAETLDYLRSARRHGLPVALSTIYWPKSELAVGVPDTPKMRWARRLLGPRLAVGAADVATGAVARARPASAFGMERRLFAGVDVLLPNSGQEQRELERIYRLPPVRHRVVRNAIDGSMFAAEPRAERAPHVLSVGRIEHRKNTLELIGACRDVGAELVLVGAHDPRDPYAQRCLELVERHGFVHHDALGHEQLLPHFYQAAVYAQVSWYETPGLATMEAACGGCRIVSTDRGSTTEYFGDLAVYCDPWSRASIAGALRHALAAPFDTRLRERILDRYTWDGAARDTLEAYAALRAIT